MNTIEQEFNELKTMYGTYDINVIFTDINGYKQVRSYTSKKEVYTEIYKLYF